MFGQMKIGVSMRRGEVRPFMSNRNPVGTRIIFGACLIGAIFLAFMIFRLAQNTSIHTTSTKPRLGQPVIIHKAKTAGYPTIQYSVNTSQFAGQCGQFVKKIGYKLQYAGCKVILSFTIKQNRPQPLPTPTPVPANYSQQCDSGDVNACQLGLLQLINSERSNYRFPPLQLNQTMSNGNGACIGAVGHSLHMSQTGTLAHDQFPDDVCYGYFAAGENIGEAGASNWSAIQEIFDLMEEEPYQPPCSNHHCNFLNPSYTQIGIGIVNDNGAVWQTEDFAG